MTTDKSATVGASWAVADAPHTQRTRVESGPKHKRRASGGRLMAGHAPSNACKCLSLSAPASAFAARAASSQPARPSCSEHIRGTGAAQAHAAGSGAIVRPGAWRAGRAATCWPRAHLAARSPALRKGARPTMAARPAGPRPPAGPPHSAARRATSRPRAQAPPPTRPTPPSDASSASALFTLHAPTQLHHAPTRSYSAITSSTSSLLPMKMGVRSWILVGLMSRMRRPGAAIALPPAFSTMKAIGLHS